LELWKLILKLLINIKERNTNNLKAFIINNIEEGTKNVAPGA
jgi:hypothetical protein